MRGSRWLALVRTLSVIMTLLGSTVLVFLGYWYFELVLWALLAPLAFASLYLAWHLWRPAKAASRALICWSLSVAWTLAVILISFKDVTLFGGVAATAIVSAIVALVHGCVRKTIAST